MPNFQVVSREAHSDKRWQKNTHFSFAAHDTLCPLVVRELPRAMMNLPIGFVVQDEKYIPVAIQGLQPSENLLVANDGKWRGRFLPEAYRGYPFTLATSSDADTLVLCFDEDSGLLTDEVAAEKFFLDDGKPSNTIDGILKFLSENTASKKATESICTTLQEEALFEPWPIQFELGGESEPKTVNGLFRINESALNELSGDSLLKLRDTRALTVAFCQLLSMSHLQQLVNLMQISLKQPTSKFVFDELDSGGSLNFDNL